MKTEVRVDIARYRIEKANKNLVEARDSFALGHHELTVGRSYYCVFIAMKALFPKGFSKVFREAKQIREKSEYGEFQTVERETAELHLKNAEEFLRSVEIVVRERLLALNGK